MNRDQFRGASRHLKGRAQTAIGGSPVIGAAGPWRRESSNRRGAVRLRHRPRPCGGSCPRWASPRHAARERADDVIEDGRHLAEEARRRGQVYGRRALRYADTNRTSTLLGLVAAAFALGWLARPSR